MIIFDLDGTLADSKASILASVRHSLNENGLGGVELDEVFVTQHDLASSFRKICSDQASVYEQRLCDLFIESYRKHQMEIAEEFLGLFPKVEETLDGLRSHFRMAVATTKSSLQAKRVLKRLKIDQYFDHIQGTDPGLRYKPAPDILLKTLEVLQAPAATAAYVGDSVHDMHAARAAKLTEIGAGYGFGGPSLLEDFKPHFLLSCISDLSRISPQLRSS